VIILRGKRVSPKKGKDDKGEKMREGVGWKRRRFDEGDGPISFVGTEKEAGGREKEEGGLSGMTMGGGGQEWGEEGLEEQNNGGEE
jgi:hypothetical protein